MKRKILRKLYSIGLIFMICQLWISAEARDISMVTVDWSPYYGGEMEDDGVITVIVKKAFQKAGHNASIKFIPWKRAMFEVERGRYDIVMGAYFNEDRAKKFNYSDPIYDIDVGLVALKSLGVTKYSKLEDLKPYKIGVSRGWINGKEFDEADYLKKETVTNQILNIRKLFKKRVDIISVAFGIFRYEVSKLKEYTLDDVVFIQPPLMKNSLYLIMSLKKDDHKKIIGDFNRELEKMKKDGTYLKILNKYGFK